MTAHRIGDLIPGYLERLRAGRQITEKQPPPRDPEPGPAPVDYGDSCNTCIAVTRDRAYFVAQPYRVDPLKRGGVVAFYEHGCGERWFTCWNKD